MDCSYALARNVVDTKYEDLPVEVVEVTKNSILDTIGVILAGSTLGEEGLKGIIELVKQGGGKKESTIIGFGDKVVSWMAARPAWPSLSMTFRTISIGANLARRAMSRNGKNPIRSKSSPVFLKGRPPAPRLRSSFETKTLAAGTTAI